MIVYERKVKLLFGNFLIQIIFEFWDLSLHSPLFLMRLCSFSGFYFPSIFQMMLIAFW